MNCRSTVLALLAVAGFVSMPALAQSMKPGLWEINNKMQSSDGEMERAMAEAQKQMANMPPEQRKMMEEMMAKQGVSMSAGKGGAGMSVKICLTKEMAERSEVPMQQDHKGNCTHNRSPMVGNTMKISYTCTNPKASGEGQVTFSGNGAYAMKMSMKSEGPDGRPQQMNMDASGKWLGADCGSIKPFMPPNAGKK